MCIRDRDGAFALFFCPHPGGFDSSRVPTPRNLPSKVMPGGQPVRGGGLGAAGIDRCMIVNMVQTKNNNDDKIRENSLL